MKHNKVVYERNIKPQIKISSHPLNVDLVAGTIQADLFKALVGAG
jgi:hypothetical protein